jgi:hypothetical protein
MHHGRTWIALALTLALAAAAQAPASPALAAKTSQTRTASTASAAKRKALHQFTGVVTAVDKSSITVEKGGKNAKTMVFTRDAEMHTDGDLARDARVTVYYRDEDGKPVARKVIVKGEAPTEP